MDLQKINKINSVTFTSREVDIIACIINVRRVKKIANILNISPRTVEGHIKNIFAKTSLNSQEDIKDFVEKSPQLVLIKQHYADLLISRLFLSYMTKVAEKLKNNNISCIIDCTEHDKLKYIIDALKLAKIKVIQKANKLPGNDEKIISLLTQEQLAQLKDTKALNNFIFICFNNRPKDKFLQAFSNALVIDCFQSDQIYSAIFKIIKLLAPNIDLDNLVSNFYEQKNNIINLKIDLATSFLETSNETREKELARKPLANMSWKLTIFLGIILILIILIYKQYYSTNRIIINFLLPNNQILLERKNINDQLDKIFAKAGNINTAILVGPGGSGKTTVARNYANKKKVSLAWEVNAETKDSLFLSLESLAYALCNNSTDRQELNSILAIGNFINKSKKLLLFIEKQLTVVSNWLIIYDNVESFRDIFEYFPYTIQSCRNGKIIITTRDDTLGRHTNVNNIAVVKVGEINKEEKLELFDNIIGNLAIGLANNKAAKELFLDNIPPFPLDISSAAYYLKATNTSPDKYLEILQNPTIELDKVQKILLNEGNTYTKTRYGIITTSLQKIIDTNQDFIDIILFISLLDSQNIPKSLLEKYKSSIVIDELIYNLKKYSFITNESPSNLGNTFSIHRNTQAIILTYLKKKLSLVKNKDILLQISNTLETYMRGLLEQEEYQKLALLLEHAKAFIGHDVLSDYMIGSIGAVLGGTYCELERFNNTIKQLIETSLKILKKYESQNSDKIALALTYLGAINRELGDNENARVLLEKSIELYQKNQTRNIEVAKAMRYLGIIYRNLGEYTKAKNLLVQSMIIYREYQPKHIGTARITRSLGVLYRDLGEYTNAKELLEESIAIYKDNPEHVSIAFSMTYLGDVYRELGDYKKAKDILEQSLIFCKESHFEEYNPHNMVWTLSYLGIVHDRLGNYKEAKQFFEQSLETYRKYYGNKNHPNIPWVYVNLSNVYRELGNYKKAKEILEQTLKANESNYHSGHINTGENLLYLGKTYSNLGEYEQAKNALEKSLAIYKKVYGDNHVQVARVLNALGENYFLNTETYGEAENVINKAKEIFRDEKHPEVMISLELLGDLYVKKAEHIKKATSMQQLEEYKTTSAKYYKYALDVAISNLPKTSTHVIRLKQKIKENKKIGYNFNTRKNHLRYSSVFIYPPFCAIYQS